LILKNAAAVVEARKALIKTFGSDIPSPVPLLAVCEAHGIEVFEAPFVEVDAAAVKQNGRYAIIIRSSAIVGRNRFSVAHEIGHVLCRHLEGVGMLENPIAERVASVFATELTMPRLPLCRRRWTPPELAREYAVSLHAARIRCEELGCLS